MRYKIPQSLKLQAILGHHPETEFLIDELEERYRVYRRDSRIAERAIEIDLMIQVDILVYNFLALTLTLILADLIRE